MSTASETRDEVTQAASIASTPAGARKMLLPRASAHDTATLGGIALPTIPRPGDRTGGCRVAARAGGCRVAGRAAAGRPREREAAGWRVEPDASWAAARVGGDGSGGCRAAARAGGGASTAGGGGVAGREVAGWRVGRHRCDHLHARRDLVRVAIGGYSTIFDVCIAV